MTLLPLVAALCMALLHLCGDRMRFLDGIPRSRWLSIAGGISVAYVVVHLLPELAEYQEAIADAAATPLRSLERHVYVLALVGLVVFYGVEQWARAARNGHDAGGGGRAVVTAFSFGTYAVYNAIIGYLLVSREGGLMLFAVALGLHFLVNDHALRAHNAEAYRRFGRWLLSAAVLGGAFIGYGAEVPEPVVGVLIAFIGGGTILNVLKEELPEDRESRFAAFLGGAAA